MSCFCSPFNVALVDSGVVQGPEAGTLNFWLSVSCRQSVFVSENFCLQMQNLGLKRQFSEEYVREKLKFWASIIASVRNLQPFIANLQCLAENCLACAVHFCSKTNKNYTQCMHFRGFSCPKKTVCFRGYAPATGFSPRHPPLFSAFSLNFWPLGVSSPFATPVSGYAYVKVSNNEQ